MEKYTFEQCVDNLNGMVEWLGDRFAQNRTNKSIQAKDMYSWIMGSFRWLESPEGFGFWKDIMNIFQEAQL